MQNCKVNILGTEYGIIIDDELHRTLNDGVCEGYTKKISVRPEKEMLNDTDSEEARKKRFDEVMRHEIMHAFFYESALDDYARNEQLVNWFAIQSPKIFKVFKELDVI